MVDGCDARLRLHLDLRAPAARRDGRGRRPARVLREAARRSTWPVPRPWPTSLRGLGPRPPGRPDPAAQPGVPPAAGPGGRPGQRTGDERGVPRRPVHPGAGDVRVVVAGRHGRRPARARCSSTRSTTSTSSSTPVGPVASVERPVGQLPRDRRHRGLGGDDRRVRARRGRHDDLGLARHPGAPEPAAGRGVLRAGLDRAGGGRLVRSGLLDPARRRAARSVRGADLVAECEARGIAMPNPDGDFIRCVGRGRPAWPDFDVALRAHRLADAVYRSAAAGGDAVSTCLIPDRLSTPPPLPSSRAIQRVVPCPEGDPGRVRAGVGPLGAAARRLRRHGRERPATG